MDSAALALRAANEIYARAEEESAETASRPASYKAIGIALAVASGCLIGVSFVLKKVGLLKANEKYQEVAGEGYGYLKNAQWWGGMTLMILGEACNFGAYAFTDAILVTSLGALSVVIATVLSAIFLKERLSMVGKVSCFLCIVGSVTIVLNAPSESAVATIQEFQDYVVTPGFLTYTGIVVVGSLFAAFWLGPRYGNKNMFTYISICSWIGGLSVVATQGLGAAIVAEASGIPQFNQWFLYIVLVFVIATLLTEIIYLNKALNIFNAAMVTPTYYVYFTSTTIITSCILFQGMKGTAMQIVTVVMGFLTICAGVVLLQLSKSAKDVPDAAVFAGDLDQIQTIAEQEQPETEPKADALRGTAAIVRRFSTARQKMEEEEFRRLQEEKNWERLAPVSEDGQPQYEWDGLRRRRTVTLSSQRSRPIVTPNTADTTHLHPPLGMSRFPDYNEMEGDQDPDRPTSPGMLSSIAGTIRYRARSFLHPGHPEHSLEDGPGEVQPSPMHPAHLSTTTMPSQKHMGDLSPYAHQGRPQKTRIGTGGASDSSSSSGRHVQIADTPHPRTGTPSLAPPTPPPHQEGPAARRQFSFQNMFRWHHADGRPEEEALHPPPPPAASFLSPRRHMLRSRGYSEQHTVGRSTEEEKLGLVKGDSHSMPTLPRYDGSGEDRDDDDDYYEDYDEKQAALHHTEQTVDESRYGRGITNTPPRRMNEEAADSEIADYEARRRRWNTYYAEDPGPPSPGSSPPRPPPPGRGGHASGGKGAFM